MVFDVESVGLHGEGFAVGWVVVDGDGREMESCRVACLPDAAAGMPGANVSASRRWLAENVPDMPITFETPAAVRRSFWAAWMRWKSEGAALFAECAWPVEARFLRDCIADDAPNREWQGPYPLHDVASIRFAARLDPLGTEPRQENEMPAHDPLADARQSARLLIEALALTALPN